MACNKQFEKLFTILDHSDYAIDTPFKKVIQEAVEKAGFCTEEPPKHSKGKKGVKGEGLPKKRKVSSYNVFVGHQIKIEGKTMAEAVPLWKQLGEKEKLVWKQKADVLNQEEKEKENPKGDGKKKEKVNPKGNEKKKSEKIRKTSGYNLFIGHQIKNKGKKMAETVGLWKELSEQEKQVWKDKAIVFNLEKENPKKKGNLETSASDSEETEEM